VGGAYGANGDKRNVHKLLVGRQGKGYTRETKM
jgi:hypothetical protein